VAGVIFGEVGVMFERHFSGQAQYLLKFES